MLVIATPCPLLIAIPVAIVGSISLAARRGIVIREPAILERIGRCRVMIFDKTGTLTYGEPSLVEEHLLPGFDRGETLRLVASLEKYSKHPLARALIDAAREAGLGLLPADQVSERPGEGLVGTVAGQIIKVTSTKKLLSEDRESAAALPPSKGGLECVVLINGSCAAVYRFRDEPRAEGADLVQHLGPAHGFEKVMLVSGDRLSEVQYLAERVGITEIHAGKSPEEKVEIVRKEAASKETVYVGDGINDAPAMLASTVGVAIGQRSDVTGQAAGAVIMDNKLGKVDELLHIGTRMRRTALESAVGGMFLSLLGMLVAAWGYLPPVAGAISQEIIDVVAVMNAIRAAWPPESLTDYGSS